MPSMIRVSPSVSLFVGGEGVCLCVCARAHTCVLMCVCVGEKVSAPLCVPSGFSYPPSERTCTFLRIQFLILCFSLGT